MGDSLSCLLITFLGFVVGVICLNEFYCFVVTKQLLMIFDLDLHCFLPMEEDEVANVVEDQSMEEEMEELDLKDESNKNFEDASFNSFDDANRSVEESKCSKHTSDSPKYLVEGRTKSTRERTRLKCYKGFIMD